MKNKKIVLLLLLTFVGTIILGIIVNKNKVLILKRLVPAKYKNENNTYASQSIGCMENGTEETTKAQPDKTLRIEGFVSDIKADVIEVTKKDGEKINVKMERGVEVVISD
jgi:hypothetical protein